MKLPYSWLKELVENLPQPKPLADLLTMRGFEVEEIASPGAEIEEVVVGKILDCRQHPNADKLSLCQVTDGEQTYSIVCGAKNMKTGDHVALARVGTVLPGDFRIERRKLRGELSEGMLCSTRELGLGDEHAGILILNEASKPGTRLVDELGLNEAIFEINVTPNRPDALSALGIAREIAAATGSALRLPDYSPIPAQVSPDLAPSVTLSAPDLCPRYTALVIEDIKIGPSPDWLKQRLEGCGVRSVNNVVDATNLVLMELGQPLHAFDYHKLTEHRIVVRRARNGEMMVSIDGDKRTLDDSMLVIADADVPCAVAGVMGGLESEVSDQTTAILLESAYFSPSAIRRTSKKLGLSSEASYRFERGVDFEMLLSAAWRCAHLITELAGGRVAGQMGIADTPDPAAIERLRGHEVRLNLNYCTRLLGKAIPAEEIEAILTSLNLKVVNRTDGELTVRVPSYRQDIRRSADLVEEIARGHGYHRFEPVLPSAPVKIPERMVVDRQLSQQLRAYLTGAGLDEAVTYSFINPNDLPAFHKEEHPVSNEATVMQNPISVQEDTMRTALLPSLLVSAQRNVAHGNNDFGLFEIARTYIPNGQAVLEKHSLAAVIVGNPAKNWKNAKEELDFFDIKGIAEGILNLCGVKSYRSLPAIAAMHPKRSVLVQLGKEKIGYFGELHPEQAENFELPGRVLALEFELLPLSEAFLKNEPQFQPFSTYPAVKRDLALLVPRDVSARQIQEIIQREAGILLESLELFDLYRGKQIGEGYTSLGFRLTFRSMSETLKEETVDDMFNRIMQSLQKDLNVQLRS